MHSPRSQGKCPAAFCRVKPLSLMLQMFFHPLLCTTQCHGAVVVERQSPLLWTDNSLKPENNTRRVQSIKSKCDRGIDNVTEMTSHIDIILKGHKSHLGPLHCREARGFTQELSGSPTQLFQPSLFSSRLGCLTPAPHQSNSCFLLLK